MRSRQAAAQSLHGPLGFEQEGTEPPGMETGDRTLRTPQLVAVISELEASGPDESGWIANSVAMGSVAGPPG